MTTNNQQDDKMREFEDWYTNHYMGMLVGTQGTWRESNHYYEAKIAWKAATQAANAKAEKLVEALMFYAECEFYKVADDGEVMLQDWGDAAQYAIATYQGNLPIAATDK